MTRSAAHWYRPFRAQAPTARQRGRSVQFPQFAARRHDFTEIQPPGIERFDLKIAAAPGPRVFGKNGIAGGNRGFKICFWLRIRDQNRRCAGLAFRQSHMPVKSAPTARLHEPRHRPVEKSLQRWMLCSSYSRLLKTYSTVEIAVVKNL